MLGARLERVVCARRTASTSSFNESSIRHQHLPYAYLQMRFAGDEFLLSRHLAVYRLSTEQILALTLPSIDANIVPLYKSVNYTYICTSTKYLRTEYLTT